MKKTKYPQYWACTDNMVAILLNENIRCWMHLWNENYRKGRIYKSSLSEFEITSGSIQIRRKTAIELCKKNNSQWIPLRINDILSRIS